VCTASSPHVRGGRMVKIREIQRGTRATATPRRKQTQQREEVEKLKEDLPESSFPPMRKLF